MENLLGGDEGDVLGGGPPPEEDRGGEGRGLHLCLEVEVEHLEDVAGAEGEDRWDGVHYCRGGLHWPAGYSVGVLEVHHCRVLFSQETIHWEGVGWGGRSGMEGGGEEGG